MKVFSLSKKFEPSLKWKTQISSRLLSLKALSNRLGHAIRCCFYQAVSRPCPRVQWSASIDRNFCAVVVVVRKFLGGSSLNPEESLIVDPGEVGGTSLIALVEKWFSSTEQHLTLTTSDAPGSFADVR